jgi:L-malate glycosyltransferase
MKPKVCLTTLEFPPDVGGVGESVHRIARMLTQLGYDVHVAVFRAVFRSEREKALAGEFSRSRCVTNQQHGITVHRLFPAIRSTAAKEQDYLSDLSDLLTQLHYQYRFDLFHAFFINEMGFLTTLLAREQQVPVINSIRGADLHKHIFSPAMHSQITWTLSHSSWTTFVSRDLMHRARVLVPEIEERSSAFLNSITPLSFENLPCPQLIDRLQGTVIGSVGSFRDKKGLEYLLDACRQLPSDSEFTLLFVGDFVDKEREYWQQELQASGLSHQVVVTGRISRLEALAYLPYMDIFAIPSIHDGCPNALLEAMFASKAIIGTQVDAIGEILINGVNGLVVTPFSSDELTVALQTLITQPHLRQSLGDEARETVLTKLAPQVEQQNWKAIYEKVLGYVSPVRHSAVLPELN